LDQTQFKKFHAKLKDRRSLSLQIGRKTPNRCLWLWPATDEEENSVVESLIHEVQAQKNIHEL